MDESVFDVLDDLEYETNVQHDIDLASLQPREIYSSSKTLPENLSLGTQEYDGNQWPQQWEIERNEGFPLDDFGTIRWVYCLAHKVLLSK